MKRLLKYCFALFCFLGLTQVAYAAESTLLNDSGSFIGSFGSAANIIDGNISTKTVIKNDAEINIEIITPAYSLYLVWDKYPESWTLEANGIILAQSDEVQQLHEYIDSFYDQSSTEPTPAKLSPTSMTLKINGGTLCDLYVFGEGTPPNYVQQWMPPYEDADMLLLPTHADDEHLYFGGTMPYYSQDKKVQVAYFTVHSAEIYRQHELLNGLYTVGIRAYPVFSDFTDYYADTIEQARGLYAEQAAIDYVSAVLRRFKPEVVIGHDINGEYGHGVHKYNTYCLQQALELGADDIDGHQVLKTYLHLYGESPIVMDWGQPLEQFGGKTALDMAVAGFDAHKSQQKYLKVEASGPYDCRKFGLYQTHVGTDVNKNDFFENIEETMYSDYVAPPPPPVSSQGNTSVASSTVAPSAAVPSAESTPPIKPCRKGFKPWYLAIPICFLPLIFLAIRKKK